ncbi:Male sterility family protein [Acanthocheilonema viteae]
MGHSQQVADIYAGQSVLVTGASGFLGKVLIEKLLYSVDSLKSIYLLIRPKNGLGPKQRMDTIIQGPLFDRLRRFNPGIFSKLIPIGGDIMEEGLGLNQLDMQTICDEVSIVFHCAATVKFDEALRISIEMNVLGTQRLVALCHMIKNLLVLVHVSTAYANCDKSEILEIVYPPPVPPNKLFEAINWMDDVVIDAITPHLLGKRPNTYTLTKALAEVQLMEDARRLPVIIVRPSIIGAMWRDPLPGWTDNYNGPTGIFAACGKGVLTNMCGSSSAKADIIPVDIVSNLMIVAAAHRTYTEYESIPVIHCCSGALNPVQWNFIVNFIERFFRAYPLNECYRIPSTHFHSSRFLFEFNFYLKHMGPAYLIDLVSAFWGPKIRFTHIYKKVLRLVETLHYFTARGWDFDSKGLIELWETTSEEDKKIFNFDVRQLDWDSYLFDYLMGVKRYVVKDRLEELPKARRNLSRLKLYTAIFNALIWWISVRIFARQRSRRYRWFSGSIGFLLTYIWTNYNFRPPVRLKSLEEYKQRTNF